MRPTVKGVLLAAAIAMGGCGGSGADDGVSDGDTGAATTDPTADTVPSSSEPPATRWIEDLPYFAEAPGLSTPVLDVFAPVDDGPWPIVVTFHPDAAMHTKDAMTILAREIAEQGAVVVNPTYGGTGTEQGRSAEIFRTAVDQSTCAVWWAVQNAADYGGDVTDVRLVGFSGGANMAAAVAMYPSVDDRHCSVPATDLPVSEVVAFEGDFTLGAGWGEVIRDDPSFYDEMTVWSHIAEYDGGPIHVLVDAKTSIAIDQVAAFLDLRHPDGPIREAWEELGVIDEDRATLVQANTMFHDLLSEAGHATTLTTIDAANHALSSAARAAIIELLSDDADR